MSATVAEQIVVSEERRDDEDGIFSLPAMTKQELKRSALEHGGYSTPALNDQLYLHYKGYRKIENLEEYINLKTLWLDSNGLQKIENISFLSNLRCLFLQRNLFVKIENLDGLNSLVQLDISENRLTKLDNLSMLPSLSTLNVSKNSLATVESISHLTECKKLASVDFSHNQLSGEGIIEVLASMPALLTINVTGNPVASEVANFRKRVISSVKTLKYLDRPIFELERATTEAWAKGGRTAELEMKTHLLNKKREEERMATQNFRTWQEEVRAKAKEQLEQIKMNGPTSEQLAEQEDQAKKKKEREAEAAVEAAREREMYRLEPTQTDQLAVSEIESHLHRYEQKPNESNNIVEGSIPHDIKEVERKYEVNSLEVTDKIAKVIIDNEEKDSVSNRLQPSEGETDQKNLEIEPSIVDRNLDEEITTSDEVTTAFVRPLKSYLSSDDKSKRVSYQGTKSNDNNHH